jgi:integrase
MISGQIITLPDTKNGTVRKVPLSTRALAVLSEMPHRLDGKVFGYTEHGCTQMFVKYCQRLNIKDLRFHDLRHHALTRMAENGLSEMELKAISGHKCSQMLSRYVNLNVNNLANKLG